ncbi:MAG: CPBP family intramembrane metalloprotease [Anaerolineae bacterium]|nr:CPBP family intramembrane metalloprotease [Anaerolineae bacterium]
MNQLPQDDFLEQIAPIVYIERPANWDERWHGNDVFNMSVVCIVLFFLLLIPALVGWYLLNPGEVDFNSQPVILISLIGSAITLPTGVAYGLRRRGWGWDKVGLRGVSPLWVIGGLIAGMLYIPINIAINQAVMQVMGFEITDDFLNSPMSITPSTDGIFALLLILFAGILIPFAEELFFRGVVFAWIRDRWGLSVGVIVSSVVFGLLHVSLGSVVAITLLGAICALAYQRTGSIWVAVALHAGNNLIAVILPLLILMS